MVLLLILYLLSFIINIDARFAYGNFLQKTHQQLIDYNYYYNYINYISTCKDCYIADINNMLNIHTVDTKIYMTVNDKSQEIIFSFHDFSFDDWILYQKDFTCNKTIFKSNMGTDIWNYLLWKPYQNKLSNYIHQFSNYRIIFIGENLGGNLAILSALELSYSNRSIDFVLTYNSPKLCCGYTCREISKRLKHINFISKNNTNNLLPKHYSYIEYDTNFKL